MPDNVFAGLDEIIERQKKAEQDAEKHTNDILSALSNTNSINATVDIDITKATNAACESIVKNATRVWRYHREKSDFRRETNKIKKRGINATMTFKEPLDIDYENESSNDIMKKIMDAIEQSPEFNKVLTIEDILEQNKDKSLDDYLNEDDDEDEIIEVEDQSNENSIELNKHKE